VAFDLEDALRDYPLPDGVADVVLNRGQCATALGVSENIITKYLDQGMPVLSKGSNGQAYEFQLSECFAWKMHRDEQHKEKRAAGDRVAAQMSLLFRGEDDEDLNDGPVLTAEQIIKESQADYSRNKAAEARRELVRAARVRESFEDMLIVVRTQIVSLVDFAEMEFDLTPEQVRKMQVRCDGTLVQMRQEFSQACPAEVEHLSAHLPISTEPHKQNLG